ncbi:MAG: hypothetical protein QGF09_16640 [Rhodospirillales bacterium]|jgi:hypothetical protein|nr:hypothetical protein [Rhodospirillales bacterium]
MTTKLLYLVSHPIQYQAPLLRRIAEDPEIDLRVIFESDFSKDAYHDQGFGTQIAWDVPLLKGYESSLLVAVDLASELENCDALWVHGWQSKTMRRAIPLAKKKNKPVLMRGENWDGAMPDGWGLRGWLKRLYLKRIFGNCAGF